MRCVNFQTNLVCFTLLHLGIECEFGWTLFVDRTFVLHFAVHRLRSSGFVNYIKRFCFSHYILRNRWDKEADHRFSIGNVLTANTSSWYVAHVENLPHILDWDSSTIDVAYTCHAMGLKETIAVAGSYLVCCQMTKWDLSGSVMNCTM
jgi:hypothetical protein